MVPTAVLLYVSPTAAREALEVIGGDVKKGVNAALVYSPVLGMIERRKTPQDGAVIGFDGIDICELRSLLRIGNHPQYDSAFPLLLCLLLLLGESLVPAHAAPVYSEP